MSDKYVKFPSADASDDPNRGPGFQITEAWFFVAVDPDDGAEGVIGVTKMMGGREVFLPLVASDAARRDSYYEEAVKIARMSRQSVRLVRLSHREDLGIIWSPRGGRT